MLPSTPPNAVETPAPHDRLPEFPWLEAMPLGHLAVVTVQGSDAATFLQGQLTQDVVTQNGSQARLAGYCSAKGRLLATFLVLRSDEHHFALLVPAATADSLVKRLRMFVLRARCTLAVDTDRMVVGLPDESVAGEHLQHAATSQFQTTSPWPAALIEGCWTVAWPGRRRLWVGPKSEAAARAGVSTADDHVSLEGASRHWQWLDILQGIPWVLPETLDQFVPQTLNLEVLGGVNFRKGCYPGQEVVARSQYRGTLKRRMALLVTEAPAQPGQDLYSAAEAEQPAGMVVNAASWSGVHLALAQVKLEALRDQRLHLGAAAGPGMQPYPLPYTLPVEGHDAVA